MLLKTHICPECGKVAIGTIDKVVALFDEQDEDDLEAGAIEENEFEYCGETDLDDQQTITNDSGESLVTCANGHEWYTTIED